MNFPWHLWNLQSCLKEVIGRNLLKFLKMFIIFLSLLIRSFSARAQSFTSGVTQGPDFSFMPFNVHMETPNESELK